MSGGWIRSLPSRPKLNAAGCALILAVLPAASPAVADSIVSTKHNLSAGGPGPVRAVTESEICVFCHTPHTGAQEAPLWNRYSSGALYMPYSSSTAVAQPGQPTGDSKLCLSCHDGTIAPGMVRSRVDPVPMQGGVTVLPPGPARLGTDLADDHPVSFVYTAALAQANGELKDPATITRPVRLDDQGRLQCTACHDAHDNLYGKFLRMENTASALCDACHEKAGWATSTHKLVTGGHGNNNWNGVPPDPWPHTEETTVTANGCENCHAPHTAGSKPRLLNFATEEENCNRCHNGNVARHNVAAEFARLSVHPVASTSGVHDPTEDPINPPRHVECADCHEPHQVRAGCIDCHTTHGTKPITASGLLAGVKGVNASGAAVDPITYQYELCFRCHADSNNRGPARVGRQIVQTNTRLEFQGANASYHPVIAMGRNTSVPSLIAPWTLSSLMCCTECHNNSTGQQAGGTGPTGPHASSFIPLLERRPELADFQTESAALYALCYKCHSRTSILSDQSFRLHRKHIQEKRTACTTCHDPHGVATQTNLINFNLSYVSPSSSGRLEYVDTGTRSGACYLRCHGDDHNPETYGN